MKHYLQILKQNKLVLFIILSLSIALKPFLDDDTRMNWFLVYAMTFAPILLIWYTTRSKYDNGFLSYILLFIVITFFFNGHNIRLTTILYSACFILYFLLFARVVNKGAPSIEFFATVLRIIIILYWIVLMAQQLCLLLGIPVINLSGYNPTEPWKLNSLMTEPSQSARVIPILMYIYISIKEIDKGRINIWDSVSEDKIVWFAFIYSCLSMLSATAYVFMVIVLLRFFDKGRSLQLISVVCLLFFIINSFGVNRALQRTIDVFQATLTLDENKIIEADNSGAYRVVPYFRGARAIGCTTYEDYFGHGIDADMRDIEPLPGTTEGSAGPFVIWYNYGLILQLFYWFLTLKVCYIKRDKISLLIWFFFVFSYGGMNNQIIWLALVLLYSYRYCLDKYVKTNVIKSKVDNGRTSKIRLD